MFNLNGACVPQDRQYFLIFTPASAVPNGTRTAIMVLEFTKDLPRLHSLA